MIDAPCAGPAALTDTQAQLEAARCLMCADPPCVAACPTQVPVKHFIRAIRFESPRRAINLIRERNVLAGICGLACPVERLCEGACSSTELSTPIRIGQLQHYAAETELARCAATLSPTLPEPEGGRRTGQNVAVIGAGPSGLAAAAELARRGHRPTVFEKRPRPGGICTYGVPAHRMPQHLVAGEIEYVKNLGVEIRAGSEFGRDVTLDHLFARGYRAIYVAVGTQQAARLPLPGADLAGVTTWKAILDGCSAFRLAEGPPPAGAASVLVVGGGSVAMDVATVVRHLGAEEIDVVCLEAPREMPADRAEREEVWKSGTRFHTRSMPIEITGAGGRVTGLKLVRIRWKEPGPFVPANAERIAGTEYWLPGAMVVFAIGARPVADLARFLPGVELDATGRIVVQPETGATSRAGVFAGGDVAVGGGLTIVRAVAGGQRAGQAMGAYLRGAGS